MQDDENQETMPRPGQWPPYAGLPEPTQWPPYPTAPQPQAAPWQQPTIPGQQSSWSSYGGQTPRRHGASQVGPRLPRREALARIRSLKLFAAALSVLGFGTLGALAATHNASASAASNSSGLPASDQNQGNNGGQQDNGGFFGNGGAGFGSGNFQRPASGSSVS